MHTSTTSPGQWPCNRTRSLMQRASGAAGSCRKLQEAVDSSDPMSRHGDMGTWWRLRLHRLLLRLPCASRAACSPSPGVVH